MHQRGRTVSRSVPHVRSTSLVVAEPTDRRDLEPTIHARTEDFEVDRARRRRAEVARAEIQESIGETKFLQEALGARQDVVEGGRALLGRAVGKQFDFVEFVHAQYATRIAPSRSGLTTEARRLRAQSNRQTRLVQDLTGVH